MVIKGTVHGEAARKYADFTYRKEIIYSLTLHSVDPDRVDPMHEYPRYCPTPRQTSTINTLDLADYAVWIGYEDDFDMSSVEVWMVPNGSLTQARSPSRVHQFNVADVWTRKIRQEWVVAEAMRQAFRPSERNPHRPLRSGASR